MYESGYKKLAWGIVFIILNINLGSINVLPNCIGYMLILSGFTILSRKHGVFEKGKTAAGILVLVTIKDIVNFGNPSLQQGGLPPVNLWILTIGAVEQLLRLYVIYIMCKGIYMAAEEKGIQSLMDSAKARFYFYLFVGTAILFLTPFSINLFSDKRMFMLAFGLVGIISMLYIMGLCGMAIKYLEEGEGTQPPEDDGVI